MDFIRPVPKSQISSFEGLKALNRLSVNDTRDDAVDTGREVHDTEEKQSFPDGKMIENELSIIPFKQKVQGLFTCEADKEALSPSKTVSPAMSNHMESEKALRLPDTDLNTVEEKESGNLQMISSEQPSVQAGSESKIDSSKWWYQRWLDRLAASALEKTYSKYINAYDLTPEQTRELRLRLEMTKSQKAHEYWEQRSFSIIGRGCLLTGVTIGLFAIFGTLSPPLLIITGVGMGIGLICALARNHMKLKFALESTARMVIYGERVGKDQERSHGPENRLSIWFKKIVNNMQDSLGNRIETHLLERYRKTYDLDEKQMKILKEALSIYLAGKKKEYLQSRLETEVLSTGVSAAVVTMAVFMLGMATPLGLLATGLVNAIGLGITLSSAYFRLKYCSDGVAYRTVHEIASNDDNAIELRKKLSEEEKRHYSFLDKEVEKLGSYFQKKCNLDDNELKEVKKVMFNTGCAKVKENWLDRPVLAFSSSIFENFIKALVTIAAQGTNPIRMASSLLSTFFQSSLETILLRYNLHSSMIGVGHAAISQIKGISV
ncbi:MAG: hypothetical protein HQK54_04710 [Oligoflexales bacterium]|nr:hypothetical protein [Oligoflexales bacterium]